MRPATQQEADAFIAAMCEHFHARRVHKQDAVEMQVIAQVLNAARAFGAKLPDTETFLQRSATTLGPLVYLPDGWTPDLQIEVFTHECQHVHQFWGGPGQSGLAGGFGFAWLYLTQPEARVRYEADAYRAGLEVAWWRTRQLPPTLDGLVEPLEGGYALGPGDVMLARELLDVAATSAAAGMISTEAGRAAIAWLKQHVPDLAAGSSGR